METASAVNSLETIQPETAQEVEDALARLTVQISEIREQMKADDASIRQSNAEYAILRAESQALRKQTESILANVWKKHPGLKSWTEEPLAGCPTDKRA